jgi:UDP-N-acetylglucosamine--N-acetylmuramyl-(pentapeptide) pyrophosphoryl-undecaprenol N-acetylglucosamine transferase
VQGLRGNGAVGWIQAPFKLAKAVIEAIAAIKKTNVDVVLGLGGFASGPGGVAAWLLRKPVVIHEQNAVPGLTNKLLGVIATRVLQGFPNCFKASMKAEWVGNPVRTSIAKTVEPIKSVGMPQDIKLLVLGGSLGAKSLNEILPKTLALIGSSKSITVRHQCGQKNLKDCKRNYQQVSIQAEVTAFISNMAEAYSWADLVVCRAGALTIAELSAVGVASILVPYPYAVDDHQTHNASALLNVGAAVLIDEAELDEKVLSNRIIELTSSSDNIFNMAVAAKTQAKVEAAVSIADICMAVSHG